MVIKLVEEVFNIEKSINYRRATPEEFWDGHICAFCKKLTEKKWQPPGYTIYTWKAFCPIIDRFISGWVDHVCDKFEQERTWSDY